MSDMISRADAIAAIESDGEFVRLIGLANRLRSLPAVEVTVKPLEWTQIGDFGWISTDELFNSGVTTLDPEAYDTERAARIRSALTEAPTRKEVMPDDVDCSVTAYAALARMKEAGE